MLASAKPPVATHHRIASRIAVRGLAFKAPRISNPTPAAKAPAAAAPKRML
ncbi:hypothetical protein D3C83_315490 [compost metagenome]